MKVFLVDDEEQAHVTMKYYLSEFFPDVEVCGSTTSVIDAGKEIVRLKPDLVFLDINMNQGTGFDLLERVGQSNSLFVFVSAHPEFAFDAIRVNIFDYLLKPVQINELTRVVIKAKQHVASRVEHPYDQAKIQIRVDGKVVLLNKDDVLYISSEGNYSTIHLTDGKNLLITKNIKKLEDSWFTNLPFFRTHQSYIINVNRVTDYTSDQLTIEGSIRIPISKARFDLFREALSRI